MNTPEPITPEAMHRPTGDALDKALRGTLVRPVMELWRNLDALVEDGSLLGVELDLTHAEIPCFLLSLAPATPKFYVELFVNEPFFNELFEEEDAEDKNSEDKSSEDKEAMPLNVLMNWMNSDTEPTFWQTGFHPLDAASLENASPDVDFTEVIDQILLLTETLSKTET